MRTVTLDDKYEKTEGRIYVTGSQALVRLPILQRARDVAAGLNTAGFISGYRGSPLGIYDLALWAAKKHLDPSHIRFSPGINEDMAATAVWGSQQVGMIAESPYDGVFAMWYGKGPGVDRSGDPLKHGSYAGAHANGGVLVLCGDDHGARSSTTAHQSDHALIHFGMPIFHPASVQEYLDLGLIGFALSRYSGCWIGFKCVTDTVEGSASVLVDPSRVEIVRPADFLVPEGGLNMRLGFLPLMAERLLYEQRHVAVQAFARANRLDGVRFGKPGRNRLGIVTTGKSYLDSVEGLRRLGIDEARAAALGIAVYKVAMVWPLEPTGLIEFAQGCEELLVVEEKRPVIEEQVAHILYNAPADRRPRLVGKRDETGREIQSVVGELDPDRILKVIAERYLKMADDPALRERYDRLTAFEREAMGMAPPGGLMRLPSFCAGCPHNTSTRVPEGSKALGGIGCHGMAVWLPERNTMALYQMGGEGAPWIGQAPFVDMKHVFQNLGDGTYFHSGLLAVRACVAANVNITYKILLNGAIAMTGGQPIEGEKFEGELTAPHVASQLHAEGVGRIAVVSDDPAKFGDHAGFPPGATFHHRDDLDTVQRELREWPGVSALIYDQSCATERRRLRKRGKVADPDERMFIHPEICEGCGDCGIQSNCIAIEPEETRLGRKRRINQSVCNKDYSCVKGFCPSFVTVKGGRLKSNHAEAEASDEAALLAALLEPALPAFTEPFSMLVAGIGGNGVVTIAALLGIAAHMEEKPCTVLDISGLAQRNGAVTSHVRFAPAEGIDLAARIPQGSADVVLACDLVVAASPECISRVAKTRTAIVANSFIAPTSAFATAPDLDFGGAKLEDALGHRARAFHAVDATGIATKMLGNAIGANAFMLGHAWQKGLIPLSRQSIETAIDLNGTAVALNRRAFALGRIAAAHPEKLAEWARGDEAPVPLVESLESLVAGRVRLLTDYQDAAYAERYRALVARVDSAERAMGGDGALARAVARSYARLMAYKDEYEVARLFVGDSFRRHLADTFEGDFKVEFNLAPPLLARRDARTGRLKKMHFGPWMMSAFRLLARLKFLRGTALDLFGYTDHRRLERRLIADYEALVGTLLAGLTPANHATAVSLAGLAETVRGYDVVKEAALAQAKKREATLMEEFRRAPQAALREAEAVPAE